MDITPDVPAERQIIQSYGGGGFRIAGVPWRCPVLVFPGRVREWALRSIADLDIASLRDVAEAEDPVEILLLGCGARAATLKPDLRDGLRARGIVVDAMDTGAACRTFNVLLAEERRVAAALIPVE